MIDLMHLDIYISLILVEKNLLAHLCNDPFDQVSWMYQTYYIEK